ncbi:MAG TPA: tetratricopeptide repeat protein [Spirochaetota bacterium]|nr:tetratricopeptide repeat protein [Spirochaetota bacterium]
MNKNLFIIIGFFFFCFSVFGLTTRKELLDYLNSKSYDKIFSAIFDTVKEQEVNFEMYPLFKDIINRSKYPDLYEYVIDETNKLLEKNYFKEVIRIYRLLSYYEKDDKRLYENYKKAYVFYTNTIISIKNILDFYGRGDVGLAKIKIKEIKSNIPPSSGLSETIILAEKEIEKSIYENYIMPGLERIDEYIKEAKFSEAMGYYLMLKRILKDDESKRVYNKITDAEKKYYLNLADESYRRKEFSTAIEIVSKLYDRYPEDQIRVKLNFYKEEELRSRLAAEAYNNLKIGNELFEKKNYKIALGYYMKYLSFVGEDKDIQKRVKFIQDYIEEEERKKIFYEKYNMALSLIENGKYDNSLVILKEIQNMPYEKENVLAKIRFVESEIARIKYESEKESEAINYIRDGNVSFQKGNYDEALNLYLLAYSAVEGIKSKDNLRLEAKHYIEKTQKAIEELRKQRELERLKRIEEGIKRGKSEYFLGNYQKALIYLQDVLSIDPENIIAKDYIDLVQEALKINAISEITPRDPFYPIFLSLKTEAEKLQQESLKTKDENISKELLNEALNKWQTIKRAYPYNAIAKKNIRFIFKMIDPESWKSLIEEDIKKALEFIDKGEKNIAYTILKDIYEDYPTYPKLKEYLELAKPKDEKKSLTPEEKRTILRLYNEALRLYSNNNYKDAFNITEKIIKENRYVNDDSIENIRSLYIKIKAKIDIEKDTNKVLDLQKVIERTKNYRQALEYYQKGDYNSAIKFAKKALEIDPNYNSALILIDSAQKRLKL